MQETQPRTDRCVKCRVEGIPDTELIITTNIGIGPGFFSVCEDCSRADGVDPAQGFQLAELRSGTLFRWWDNIVRQWPMRPDEDF